MRVRFLPGLAALCALEVFSLMSAQASQSIAARGAFSSGDARFVTPAPPYPFLVYGDTHQWTALVTFDERGDATEAVLIRSTGSAQLDNTITKWIRTHWKAHVGKAATLMSSGK